MAASYMRTVCKLVTERARIVGIFLPSEAADLTLLASLRTTGAALPTSTLVLSPHLDNAAPSAQELDGACKALLARGSTWRVKRFSATLAVSFSLARHRLLTMNYFPAAGHSPLPPVLAARAVGEWGGANEIRQGDAFVQHLLVLPFVSVSAVDIVARVYDKPGAAGFSLVTTIYHDEIGEHTAVVRETGASSVTLDVLSGSTFAPHVMLTPGAVPWARYLQNRAHKLSIEYIGSAAA